MLASIQYLLPVSQVDSVIKAVFLIFLQSNFRPEKPLCCWGFQIFRSKPPISIKFYIPEPVNKSEIGRIVFKLSLSRKLIAFKKFGATLLRHQTNLPTQTLIILIINRREKILVLGRQSQLGVDFLMIPDFDSRPCRKHPFTVRCRELS